MSVEISIQGADRLGALSARLKDADRTLQRSMRSRLRSAVKPVVEEVKTVAAEHSRTIPRSIVAEFRYTEKTAGVKIKAKRSRMPKGHEALPALEELGSKGSGGAYIRHPVFAHYQKSRITGRRSLKANRAKRSLFDRRQATWVNQPNHPFLYKTVQKNAARIRLEMTRIFDDVERSLDA